MFVRQQKVTVAVRMQLRQSMQPMLLSYAFHASWVAVQQQKRGQCHPFVWWSQTDYLLHTAKVHCDYLLFTA